MEIPQISDLLRPFLITELDDTQLHAVQQYLALLVRWNARTNLTSIRDDYNIVIRHFGESLFAASLLLSRDSDFSIIDVGSGAGFPGLPLKIFAPGISLTLIESQNKKVTFLREVIRGLGLRGATVFHGRAEQYRERADLVTLRAVEHFVDILPIAASLVRRPGAAPGGTADGGPRIETAEQPHQVRGSFGLLVGSSQVKEAARLLPSYRWRQPVPIPRSASRVVLIGTPEP